jgi:fimbrial chaperone protein
MTRRATNTFSRWLLVAGGSFLFQPLPALAADGDGAAAAAPNPDAAVIGPAVLSVAPIRVELAGDESGATVRLTNASDHALPVQTRLFAWSQESGEDVYAPSTDLIVSPSIISIPSGETQVVRVLRKGAASSGEKRFRLVIDQLPDPTTMRPGQAQTRIRFTVPVFVDRDKAAPAQFAWRMTRTGLELVNSGGLTARILDVKLSANGRDVPVEDNALRYVMGNSTIAWPVGNGCALGPVKVTAQIDGQTVDGSASPACG